MTNPSDDPRDFDPMPADLPEKIVKKLNEELDKKEGKKK